MDVLNRAFTVAVTKRRVTRLPLARQLGSAKIQFQAVGPIVAAEKQHDFDPRAFLATIGNVVLFPKKQTIFAQGDLADAVFYVQTGKVRLTVVSKTGKEATTGFLGDGDFFGEGSLAGQAVRMGSATAMVDCNRSAN